MEGPKELFNGLIIWFLKPVSTAGGISGLFSNTNYTGLWLATTLPLTLFLIHTNHKKRKYYKKFQLGLIATLIVFFIFQTNSRNALLGLILSLNIILGTKTIVFLLIALMIFSLLLNYFSLSIINLETLNTIIPENLISKLSNIKLDPISPRIMIWGIAISLIFSKPFLDGVQVPFLLYLNDNNVSPPLLKIDAMHSHNLFLELSHNLVYLYPY